VHPIAPRMPARRTCSRPEALNGLSRERALAALGRLVLRSMCQGAEALEPPFHSLATPPGGPRRSRRPCCRRPSAIPSAAATLIGVVLLLGVVVFGFVLGPKWWHWGSFIVLTIVLFIPLAMAFFIPLPIVVVLNVAISHSVWLKKHGAPTMKGITVLR